MSNIYRKVSVGEIVRLSVMDWCRHQYQMMPADVEAQATLKYATLYGVVVALSPERVALAAQVFADGAYRDVLTIPTCCVINYEIWGHVEDSRFKQQDAEAMPKEPHA